MAIVKKTSIQKSSIIIDLTGPEGNVFVLMGYAKSYAKKLGLDEDKVLKDMKSSDYEHAVSVFDKHFGSFVTFLR